MHTPKSPIQRLSNEDEAKIRLTQLLKQAAQLEHSLLNAYLYTACSLKSTPQEFATANGQSNQRRAIQFERVRAWKKSIMMVCHEEMLHLHYVECMIRSLGLQPYLGLPKRDPKTNNWLIPNWDAKIGEETVNEEGTEIPIEKLTIENIRNFVLYESTDALQDKNPFSPKLTKLYTQLYEFELDLHLESVLYNISDEKKRKGIKEQLKDLYTNLSPLPVKRKKSIAKVRGMLEEESLPPIEELRFQSIADFYLKGVQPLYEQAFDRGWVKYSNWNLNNELLNPDYAAEGFLPIGPIYRGMNFSDFSQGNTQNALNNFKDLKSIIKEIVEEGEGVENFEQDANKFLKTIEQIGGARVYLTALKKERNPRTIRNPWLAEGELFRQSHLYRFLIIMMELKQEKDLAKLAGTDFVPSRTPLVAKEQVGLTTMTKELPKVFNSVYLAMLSWLSRIYEVQEWKADKASRMTIESLASWPLMSIAIRPFLELASFLPITMSDLFVLTREGIPNLPLHAQQLFSIYNNPERSEEINAQMDYFAVRVLEDAAIWAKSKLPFIEESTIEQNHKEMIIARLTELSHLDEFKKQFPFREAGGYSNTPPDIAFVRSEPNADKYAEGPSLPQTGPRSTPPLFKDTLALRIRFAGRGLVQLATDPDPTFDETGCSGTQMFHAADGDKRFDKALVWQDFTPERNIIRGPKKDMPSIGVNCTEISLLTTTAPIRPNGFAATAGYIPLQIMNSSGAVQTSGVQQKLQVDGFTTLQSISTETLLGKGKKIPINLEDKNNTRPFLNGLNHLVWKDGEPIDPFIFALYIADEQSKQQPELAIKREIFNEDKSILEMSPLERVYSARGPVGFDSYQNIPDWVMENLSESEQQLLATEDFPTTYLVDRTIKLAKVLKEKLKKTKDESQENIDAIISLAQRMKDFSVPKGTTVGWLTVLLHYGHTLSGKGDTGVAFDQLFAALKNKLHIPLSLDLELDRNQPNGRWLLNYTKGVMDTDSLTDLVYGELYIPVKISASKGPIKLSKTWKFNRNMQEILEATCCQFDKPFWASFKIDKNTRSIQLPDGTTIIETLKERFKTGGYSYTMTGPKDLENYAGEFVLTPKKDTVELSWNLEFSCTNTAASQTIITIIGQAMDQMTAQMNSLFSPRA